MQDATIRPISAGTAHYDPAFGAGQFVMTAHGWKPRHDVEAMLKAEADRLRKQEPSEPTFV